MTASTADGHAPRLLHHVATPFVHIDERILQANIDRMARYAEMHRINLRPHVKTHKSLRIAEMQCKAGAAGLTTAKAGEAEVMSSVTDDLLIAYPCADSCRAGRAARLARKTSVRVAVDNEVAVEALADAAEGAGSIIGVLIDLDVGMHRTGVQSPEAAVRLAEQVNGKSGLRLDGLFCYPGHIWNAPSEQNASLASVGDALDQAISYFKRGGLNTAIVSGGSTPTAFQSHLLPNLTEIRPGTYVYNDMNTVAGGFCTLEDCAVKICCTVVSDAVPGKVVIDAGTKTLSSDRNIPAPDTGYGHVIGWPEAKITRLSEEHGEIDMLCASRPMVGQRIYVIPNHVCPCINLHDTVWISSANHELLQPIRVDARGELS